MSNKRAAWVAYQAARKKWRRSYKLETKAQMTQNEAWAAYKKAQTAWLVIRAAAVKD